MGALKENYRLANCCQPQPGGEITGYYSHDNIIKVHRTDCTNLAKADSTRLVKLVWGDIAAEVEFKPEKDYDELSAIDFSILTHHRDYGFDYSSMVAVMIKCDRKTVFDRHKFLKEAGLIKRVAPKMIQYRKNIVKNKWIKHRNHTYYDITPKGLSYLKYFLSKK